MRSVRAAAVAVLSLLAGPFAWAQDPVVKYVGSLVRVTAPSVSPKRLVGTLAGANESFLRLSTSAGVNVIPRDAVQKLQWSRGLHKPVLTRALEFAVVGGAFGLAVAFAANDPNEKDAACHNRLTCVGVGAGAGAVIGLVAGAVAQPQHDWADVPGVRVRVALRPRPRGAGASMVMSW